MIVSTSSRHRARSGLQALALMAALSGAAFAQQDPAQFPREAIRFLDAELPAMEAAVRSGDRGFFHDGTARMVEFADAWGFKAHANPALASYRMCTAAIEDYLLVGLCKLVPNGEDCTPALAGGFDRNLQACRDAAAR